MEDQLADSAGLRRVGAGDEHHLDNYDSDFRRGYDGRLVQLEMITQRTILTETGIYMVFSGDCGKIEKKDTWVHLGLNVVATVLLASSNYCMQLLSAPSRTEVDKAHAKQKWLDVGIASVRNLRFLRKKKVASWWLLGISSIPLHLVSVPSVKPPPLTAS